jgi:hypothetical protein
VDKQTLRAFSDLEEGYVHNYLVNELDKTVKALISAKEDVIVRMLQGKSQVYSELLALITTAEDLIRDVDRVKPDTSKMY